MAKKELIQLIAQGHAQQIAQQQAQAQQLQSLQAEYDEWNKQQDIAQLQAEYDAWNQANPVEPVQPVQAVQTKKKKEIPSLKKAPVVNMEDYMRQQQEEQDLASNVAEKKARKERRDRSVNDTLNTINSKAFQDLVKQDKVRQAEENRVGVRQIAGIQDYVDKLSTEDSELKAIGDDLAKAQNWLEPDYKMTPEEEKEARRIAREGMDRLTKPTESTGSPAYFGRSYKDMTPEEQSQYKTYQALDTKTNDLASTSIGAANTILKGLQGIGDLILTANQANAPTSQALDIQRDVTNKYRENVNQFNKNAAPVVQGAQTQNPIAYGAGAFGANAMLYGLTSPLIEGAAGAAGLGAAGTAIANQVAQAGQDAVLDILPEYERMRSEGNVDKGELLKRFGGDVAANAVMGSLPTLGSMNYDYLTKTVGNNADMLKNMDVTGSLKNAPDIVREAYQAKSDIPTRQIDEAYNNLPTLEDEVVNANNNQFRDLMNQYNSQFKDTSAMKNIYSPEDLDASMNGQLKTLMDENLIPERLNPVAEMEPVEIPQIESEIREMNNDLSNMWGAPKNPLDAVSETVSEAKPVAQRMDNVPQRTIKNFVDNPELTSTANQKVNDELFLLEAPFNDPRVLEAASNVAGKVQSDAGFKLMDDYATLSQRLRDTVDDEAEKVIRDQLAEMKGNIKTLDKAEQAAVKDMIDFADIETAVADYKKALNGNDVDAIDRAAKNLDNVRNRLARRKGADKALASNFSGSYGPLVKRPQQAYLDKGNVLDEELAKEWFDYDNANTNRFVRDAEPDTAIKGNSVPGADPMQFFGGTPTDEWKTSKFRTNTAEKLGWGDSMPEQNYAYRVYSEAEQNADALNRYATGNTFNDLMNKNYDEFDEVDIKAAFNEMKRLEAAGDIESLRQADRLGQKTAAVQRGSGRVVQASAEYTRNTFSGALQDAHKVQDDVLTNWRSRNTKAKEGNSRIARALSDMGNKWKTSKVAPELTHDQIKRGVVAELQREVGSVEKYFNDSDIEFLTTLAEDKSIPVWKITSEIEHKLNTGNWYSLDESLPIPQPTNRKLQNALNSLIENDVRKVEAPAPSLGQIREEVRNTLGNEAAALNGTFTDDDIDYLANLINNGASKQELADALDTKLATGTFGISDETLQEVNNIFKEISNYDVNSKQFVEGQDRAYKLLADEILPNATPMEKFEAWRYLAMLGNPKTMLRNKVGNDTFNVVTGISNNIAAMAEAGIDKAIRAGGGEGIQRTKSVLNPVADSGLIKAAAEDADASRFRQLAGSKYEKMDKNTLRQSKSVFNSKLAQLYEKVTDAGISDYKATKRKFSTSLAGYLKANGYDANIFKAEDELTRLKNLSETRVLSGAELATMNNLKKDVDALEKARDYALKQAEYATFHEDNEVAKLLTKWSRDARSSDNLAANALGMMIEGTVPFKKTPANVLRSGLEYSPLGAIKSIKKTGKLIYENTGSRAGNLADTYLKKTLSGKEKEVTKELAADVIDSWSKTLTGTGLTALGFYLYNKGVLHSSDPDTKYQDQLEGHQNYAIEINGKSYTLDWAAPTIMPLMVGAEAAKIWPSTGKSDEDFFNNINDYWAAANRIVDPLIETSMLSGVKDTLETAASASQYNEDLNIPALLLYNTMTGYATQGVPTIAGQIARTIDPVRRSTYSKETGPAGIIDKQIKKQMNKIPGLSMLNEEYVDTYGRTQQNSPFDNPAANLAYQMFSPGYLADINETTADRVSRQAYESSENESVLPKWQSSVKIDGEKVSPETYTKYAKAYGNANYEIRDKLANNKWFNSLDQPAKDEILKDVNTIANHVGKANIDPNYSTNSAAYEAYSQDGIPGLVDYYKAAEAKSTLKELSGGTIDAGSNAGKEALKYLQNGNEAQAKKVIKAEQEYNKTLKSTGLSKSETTKAIFEESGSQGLKTLASFQSYGKDNATAAYKRYEAAKKQIPGLTAKQYKDTVSKMDGLNGEKKNGQISQKEMLAYLNSGNFSQAEAQALWTQYGDEWTTSIGKNKKGQWSAKRN